MAVNVHWLKEGYWGVAVLLGGVESTSDGGGEEGDSLLGFNRVPG